MSRYILDTDHLTLLQQAHPSVRRRATAIAANTPTVTIIAVEEQLRGWLDAVRRHSTSPRQL